MEKWRKMLALKLLMCIVLSMSFSASAETLSSRTIASLDDLHAEGVRLGVQTGTVFDELTASLFPEADMLYLESSPDLAQLLISGQIDGFMVDEPVGRMLEEEIPGVRMLDEILTEDHYGAVFSKTEEGEALCDMFNQFLKKIREDGAYEELMETWFGTDESKKVMTDIPSSGEKGVLRIAICPEVPPFSYYRDNQPVGVLLEIGTRFCLEMGYGIEWNEMAAGAIIPAVTSEKCDMAVDAMSITEERKEQVNFSDSYYEGGTAMMVRRVESAFDHLTAEELNSPEKRIGSLTGSSFQPLIDKAFPEAQNEYYDSTMDMMVLVGSGQLDACVVDMPTAIYAMNEIDSIAILEPPLRSDDYGLAFAKDEEGEELCQMFSDYIRETKKSGLLKEMEEKWFSSEIPNGMLDLSGFTGEKGTLKIATNSTNPPFVFIQDGKISGFLVELVTRCCMENGWMPEWVDMAFGSTINSVLSGKCDLLALNLAITQERKEQMLFSEPFYEGGISVVVRRTEIDDPGKNAGMKGFFQSLAVSFEKTFIREQRWKLILEGIVTTVVITFFAAMLGTILGFFVCLLRMRKNPVLSGIARVYVRLLQGTPMVVLLMILFYIVFARSGISGELVAIIGFGMNFAAYVSEMIRTGIEAVDAGQREAALAIGYTKVQAFMRIVLPQAARHFLPVYRGEFISLVKGTSVVGYIAVQDLTKMSDIIRSRTYEAFFPLIATAILYFVIAGFFTWILNRATVRVEPDRKHRTIKGVKMQ